MKLDVTFKREECGVCEVGVIESSKLRCDSQLNVESAKLVSLKVRKKKERGGC